MYSKPQKYLFFVYLLIEMIYLIKFVFKRNMIKDYFAIISLHIPISKLDDDISQKLTWTI